MYSGVYSVFNEIYLYLQTIFNSKFKQHNIAITMMMRQRYCLTHITCLRSYQVYCRKNIDKTSDVMNANYCCFTCVCVCVRLGTRDRQYLGENRNKIKAKNPTTNKIYS